jgi:antitoxin VapB
MVIHVKDDETDALVRRLASLRGIGITSAIKEAVAEAIEADQKNAHKAPLDEQLETLFERWDRLPRSSVKTDKAFFDDLWGEGEQNVRGGVGIDGNRKGRA